jgi:hypothetical protein
MRENYRALFLLFLVLSGQVDLVSLGNDKKNIFWSYIRSVIEFIIILEDKSKEYSYLKEK